MTYEHAFWTILFALLLAFILVMFPKK